MDTTTDRHGWIAVERRGEALEGRASATEDRRAGGRVRRLVDAWWRGWIAFTGAIGEPYLPLGGRSRLPGPVTGNDRRKAVAESEGERCA